MEHWEDRTAYGGLDAILWPLDRATGKHWCLRLAALTLGWLWMVPALILFSLLFLVPIWFPLMMWRELSEE